MAVEQTVSQISGGQRSEGSGHFHKETDNNLLNVQFIIIIITIMIKAIFTMHIPQGYKCASSRQF